MSTTPFAIAAQRASQSQPANLTSDVKGVLLGWIRNGDYPPGASRLNATGAPSRNVSTATATMRVTSFGSVMS